MEGGINGGINSGIKLVTFGEIMGRIEPEGFKKFRQALPGKLGFTFAGSEANVAVSFSLMGGTARFVTALPANSIGDACVGTLRNYGVDTSYIVRSEKGSFGFYFVETGANQRPSTVLYDREGTAISMTGPGEYDWDSIFKDAAWFHISGITPAVSKPASEASLDAVKTAKEQGLTVSCDLNFRKKLWKWEPGTEGKELARRVMGELLESVDVVIGNEEDASDVLDIQAGSTDVEKGFLEVERYPEVAKQIISRFPQVKIVATTLRESISATHNNWGGMLYDAKTGKSYFAPVIDGEYKPYRITSIVDRVGGGDAFSAGLVFALMDENLKAPGDALAYAVAAGCLCQSIEGDFNISSREEVEALMKGSVSGRVKR